MTDRVAAIVVAFDGLVAETQSARTHAVIEALNAEVASASERTVAPLVLGRSLDEVVEAVLRADADARGYAMDHTVRDLTVLRSRRAYSAIVSHGLPLVAGAAAWISARVTKGVRVVLRADSARGDVEQLLLLSGLSDIVAFTRCSDDLPRTRSDATVRSAWQAIAARLTSMRLNLASCQAMESSTIGSEAASQHVANVHLLSSLHGVHP